MSTFHPLPSSGAYIIKFNRVKTKSQAKHNAIRSHTTASLTTLPSEFISPAFL